MSDEQYWKRNLQIHQILGSANLTDSEKTEKLKSYGLVKLDVNYDESTLSSAPGDVSLTKPTVYFDYYEDEWELYGEGNWVGSPDFNPPWYLYLYATYYNGNTFNCGGLDSYGIFLQDTYGDFNGTSLISSYADTWNYSHTVKGEYVEDYSYTRDLNPSSYGFSHSMQDYWICYNEYNYVNSAFEYSALNFFVSATYSSSFENYHGNAVTFLAHTWGSTNITGVSLGKDGIGFDWENGSNGWPAESQDSPF